MRNYPKNCFNYFKPMLRHYSTSVNVNKCATRNYNSYPDDIIKGYTSNSTTTKTHFYSTCFQSPFLQTSFSVHSDKIGVQIFFITNSGNHYDTCYV